MPKGNPVALVSVAEVGVPRTGVMKVGDVQVLFPTQTVPVVVGSVSVPVFTMVAITGAVRVLLVSV